MENTNTNGSTGIKRDGKKSFNPTITALFDNEKFGTNALLSTPLTAEGFEAVQKHLQIGSRLLLKKAPRPASNGTDVYFLEILPALDASDPRSNRNNKRNTAANQNDEI